MSPSEEGKEPTPGKVGINSARALQNGEGKGKEPDAALPGKEYRDAR